MRVTRGRVVNGKIEVPGEELAEGLVVTILAPEDRETFTLGLEVEGALLAAIEAADHDEWVRFSLKGLERAYGEDEPEYSLDMLKCPNPEYEAPQAPSHGAGSRKHRSIADAFAELRRVCEEEEYTFEVPPRHGA